MSLYDTIRQAAANLGEELTETEVNRIAGTLRFAGMHTATEDVIKREIKRFLEECRNPTPRVEAASDRDAGTFRQIDASIEAGTCPRCKRKMRDVKLADYTPAKYCDSECRIVLWPNSEK